MICPKCSKENSEISKFCTSCGASLADVFQQNRNTSNPAEDKSRNSEYSHEGTKSYGEKQSREDGFAQVEASKGTRFGNYMLDMIFLYGMSFIGGLILGSSGGYTGESGNILVTYLIGFAIVFGYYAILEGLTGRSIGKYITGTKVVDENGEKPDFNTILIRSLCRLIPFEQFSFLGSDSHGWHDKFSKTRVVRA